MNTKQISWRNDLILDIITLVLVYIVPAVAHFFSLPVYMLEPMRFILLGALFFSGNVKNTYILAITIPIFSMLTSGHPPPLKTLLICLELFANVFLFYFLYSPKKNNLLISLFISIIISKIIYYFLKFLFIEVALIDGKLISIPIITQLITTIIISLSLFGLQTLRAKGEIK
jgi:hypothetical protein